MLRSILAGGLTAGVLDGLYAALAHGLTIRVWQYVASGILGRASFERGWTSASLGIALHFVVALGAATVYNLLGQRIPALLRQPFLWGPLFGIGLYFFMNDVVIPLSAATRGPLVWKFFIGGLLVHAFGVGLPIAWFASRARQ